MQIVSLFCKPRTWVSPLIVFFFVICIYIFVHLTTRATHTRGYGTFIRPVGFIRTSAFKTRPGTCIYSFPGGLLWFIPLRCVTLRRACALAGLQVSSRENLWWIHSLGAPQWHCGDRSPQMSILERLDWRVSSLLAFIVRFQLGFTRNLRRSGLWRQRLSRFGYSLSILVRSAARPGLLPRRSKLHSSLCSFFWAVC